MLRQLFYNLIDNSLKYGETLTKIRVHYEQNNDHLDLFYEDNGGGIPQAVKQKIFAEGYTTGKRARHGLYLIKRMMEVYGWIIKEKGDPGKGVLFMMTIPKTDKNERINYRIK